MIRFDFDGIEQVQRLAEEAPTKLRSAGSSAINRATTHVRTEFARSVRSIYRVKHSDVINSMKIVKSTPITLNATITATGSTLPVSKFSMTQTKRGMSIGIKKGSKKVVKSSFQIKGAIGGDNAFIRLTAKRTPVKGLHGPSIPQMIGNEQIASKVVEKGEEMLMKRMVHEAERALGG